MNWTEPRTARPTTLRRALRAAAFVLPMLVFGGCDDDPTSPGPRPNLPPAASMEVDISFFDDVPASVIEGDASAAMVGTHFITAAISAKFTYVATIAVMALPVALFKAAASAEPVYEGGAYHWRYAHSVGGTTFLADLSGRAEGASSFWEMRITSNLHNPPLEDFLWYDGRVQLTGQSGEWHIYDAGDPSASNEVLSIEWAHPDPNSWTLTFTNVNPESAEAGDMLTYEVDGMLRAIRYYDASDDTEAVIEWNELTGAGSIQAPGYNNGQKGCWDTLQNDTPCS